MSVSTVEYSLMAANVYGNSKDVKSPENTIPVGSWVTLESPLKVLSSGFMGSAYLKGNDLVIAYAGTTPGVNDWWSANVPAATALVMAPQLAQAAEFYLDTLKNRLPPGIDAASLNVSFTGHSLGGGLASLMSVFFDKKATVFDEAPFQKSADSMLVVNQLRTLLVSDGYMLPSELVNYEASWDPTGAFLASPSRVARQINVSQYAIKGEVLSVLSESNTTAFAGILGVLGWIPAAVLSTGIAKIIGTQSIYDLHATEMLGWKAGPIDLHSIALLSGILQSPQFFNTLTEKPELLAELFAGRYAGITPTKDRHMLLELLVARQALGEGALDLLSLDVNKLATSGYIGQVDGQGVHTIAAILMDVVLASLYKQAMTRTLSIYDSTPFVAALNSQPGSITIDLSSIGTEFDKVAPELSALINAALAPFSQTLDISNQIRITLQNGTEALDVSFTEVNTKDVIIGFTGNDRLNGGGGTDIMIGGSGNDNYTVDNPNDLVLEKEDEGIDTVLLQGTWVTYQLPGGVEKLLLQSDANVKTITGNTLGNTIVGNSSTTHILGGPGDDSLTTSSSGVVLEGGTGRNTYSIVVGDHVRVDGESDIITIQGSPSLEGVSYNDFKGTDNLVIHFNDVATNDITVFGWYSSKLVTEGNSSQYIPQTKQILSSSGTLLASATSDVTGKLSGILKSAGNIEQVWTRSVNGSWSVQQTSQGTAASWGSYDTLSGLKVEGGRAPDGTHQDKIYGGGVAYHSYSTTTQSIPWQSVSTQVDNFSTSNRSDGSLQWTALAYPGGPVTTRGDIAPDGTGGVSVQNLDGSGSNVVYFDDGTVSTEAWSAGGEFFSRVLSYEGTISDSIEHSDGSRSTETTLQDGSGIGFKYNASGAQIGASVRNADGTSSGWIVGANGQQVSAEVEFPRELESLSSPTTIHAAFLEKLSQTEYGATLANELQTNATEGWLATSRFMFQLGDGHVVITQPAVNSTVSGVHSIVFGAGISAATTTVTHTGVDGTDLLITLNTNDTVTIKNWFPLNGTASTQITSVVFSDGTLWSNTDVTTKGSTLVGTISNDDLVGFARHSNILNGGEGADLLHSGTKGDVLSGEDGNDILLGGAGADVLNGGAGNDILGGSDSDTGYLLNGAYFAPRYGNSYQGGAGDDVLNGTTKADLYLFNQGDGQDSIHEVDLVGQASGQVDVLRFGAGIVPTAVVVSRNGGDLQLQLANGTDRLTIANWYATPGSTNNQVEQVQFSDGTNWTAAELTARGLIVFGTVGDDTLTSLEGFANTLNGAAGNDILYGGGGDDTLNGGLGNDTLSGGVGNNAYQYKLGDGVDIINETNGVDEVRLTGVYADATTIRRIGNNLSLNFGSNTQNLTLTDWYIGASYQVEQVVFGDISMSIPALEARALSVFLAATESEYVVQGFIGTTVIGNSGANIITGNAGNDTLDGRYGNDIVYGGAGDDYLWGGTDNGIDTLVGETGNDHLYGSGGDDVLDGGDGTDFLDGGLGNDALTGSNGDDQLWGNTGNDQLQGGAGNDLLMGEAGDDVLNGGAGTNTLAGGLGNDTFISAGSGDHLWGGGGIDTYQLSAGTGNHYIHEDADGGVVDMSAYFTAGQVISMSLISSDQLSLTSSTGEVTIISGWSTQQVAIVTGTHLWTYSELTQAVQDGRTTLASSPSNYAMASSSGLKGGLDSLGASLSLELENNMQNNANLNLALGQFDSTSGYGLIDFGGANLGFNLESGNSRIDIAGQGNSDRTIVLSIGGNVTFNDLKLSREANDLILHEGDNNTVRLSNWYSNGVDAQDDAHVFLQIGTGSSTHVDFNFNQFAAAFDASMRTASAVSLSLGDAITQFNLSQANVPVIGDAIWYFGNQSLNVVTQDLQLLGQTTAAPDFFF